VSKNDFQRARSGRSGRTAREGLLPRPARASARPAGRTETPSPVCPRAERREDLGGRIRGSESGGRPLFRPLFTPSDPFVTAALNALPDALDELMPLARAHRADLPDAIRELSALLTSDRGGMNHSYWSAPRFVSAYLRYFLPWNLVRLTRLLPSLDLPSPVSSCSGPEARAEETARKVSVVDLGSGPLTLPLALWLSRPDWRSVPLTLLCADTAPRPMELGRRLLEYVAARSGEPLLWRVRLSRAPFGRAMREAGAPRLLMAGNVLNELRDAGGSILAERMAEAAVSLERALPEGGAALFVEPGTRFGGTLTASLREAAMEEGLKALAPCPHDEPCPLLGRRSRGWCHASLDAGGPTWLAALSRAAGLPKDSLSLSFMLLGRERPDPRPCAGLSVPAGFPTDRRGGRSGGEKEAASTGRAFSAPLVARILSDAFPVPGMGYARYACAEGGLALVPDAAALPSGALVACRRPDTPRRDSKSGALELRWEANPGRN